MTRQQRAAAPTGDLPIQRRVRCCCNMLVRPKWNHDNPPRLSIEDHGDTVSRCPGSGLTPQDLRARLKEDVDTSPTSPAQPATATADAFAKFETDLNAKLDEIRQAAADIYSGALNPWHGANRITKLCNEIHAPLPKGDSR